MYSILINDKSRWRINTTRGVRQGGLISFFLFLLVVDILTRLVSRGAEGKVVEGFEVG